LRQKLEKVPWDMGRNGVVVGAGYGVEGKGKGRDAKHAFRRAARHTFIISRIFARGRYSLIV